MIVLAGGVLHLYQDWDEAGLIIGFFKGEPADLRSLAGIVADTLALRPKGIIQCGLLFLIATPICRSLLLLSPSPGNGTGFTC